MQQEPVDEGDWKGAAQRAYPPDGMIQIQNFMSFRYIENGIAQTKMDGAKHLKDLFGEHTPPPEFWKDPAGWLRLQNIVRRLFMRSSTIAEEIAFRKGWVELLFSDTLNNSELALLELPSATTDIREHPTALDWLSSVRATLIET
jgi:hypothetical protein